MGTPGPTDVKTKQKKQKVYVFTKLQIFQKASYEVEKLLKDVCEFEGMNEIEIEEYKIEDTKEKPITKPQPSGYLGITVVVVIDARQTRTIITPGRRDSSVDHWDELSMLSSITDPQGSILFVVYGDECSKDGNELHADKWWQVWKFNDVFAFQAASKGMVFTIYDEFNEKQKERIREYLNEVPLVPHFTGQMDILSLTPKPENEDLLKCLDFNPFLVRRRDDICAKCNMINFSSYSHLKDIFTGGVNPPTCLKIFHRDRRPIPDCSAQTVKSQLIKSSIQSPQRCHLCSFPPVIDRVLFVCATEECFQKASEPDRLDRLERETKVELEICRVRLRGEVFPVSSITTERDGDIRDVILILKKQAKEEFTEDKKKRLESTDHSLLVKLHCYHLTQIPTLRDPDIELDKEETEKLKGEKEELERDITSLKKKLKVKEDQVKDVKDKLHPPSKAQKLMDALKSAWSNFKP